MRNFSFVSGSLATFAICLGCALVSRTAVDAAAGVPSAAAIAADDRALLEFTQGAPVTSAERDRIVAEARDGMAKHPDELREADTVVRSLLVKLPALGPLEAEAVREELRVRFALLPDSVPERKIVEHHDPSIAIDRARGQAITARTIVDIRRATQWLAQQLEVAGPSDDFMALETAYFRKNFSKFTNDQQDACTHVARNMSTSIQRFDKLSPEEHSARLARLRSTITKATPLDGLAVFAMARVYAEVHAGDARANDRFLATTRAMFHVQNMNQLVTGLQGEMTAQQFAPH